MKPVCQLPDRGGGEIYIYIYIRPWICDFHQFFRGVGLGYYSRGIVCLSVCLSVCLPVHPGLVGRCLRGHEYIELALEIGLDSSRDRRGRDNGTTVTAAAATAVLMIWLWLWLSLLANNNPHTLHSVKGPAGPLRHWGESLTAHWTQPLKVGLVPVFAPALARAPASSLARALVTVML